MTTLAEIQTAVEQLKPEEIAKLSDWLEEYRAGLWDQEIEADARAGRLDHLADEAIRQHRAGLTAAL
ncbi:MAG: hypothetical protein ACKVT1_07815 [Dehalococcoidia bacterium]